MARKRKHGHRTKSGRLSRAFLGPARDAGTSELQAKRQAIVGDGADPTLSSTVPGILYARGHIDRDQFASAMRFRQLRCSLYGPPWPLHGDGNEIAETAIISMRDEFNGMAACLTLDQKEAVEAACVFDVIPQWFYCAMLKRLENGQEQLRLVLMPEDHRERALLMDGLNSLVNATRQSRRRLLPRLTGILEVA